MNSLQRITRQIECRLVKQGGKITVEFPAEWQIPPVILPRDPEFSVPQTEKQQTENQTEKQDKEWLILIG